MDLSFKEKVHQACLDSTQEKLAVLHEEIKSLQTAANEETKSSAGDKYETGRAMLMLEIEKLGSQIGHTEKLNQNLRRIDPDKKQAAAGLGALVKTDQAVYYLAGGLGKMEVDDQDVFVLSLASPLGRVLEGKKANEDLTFTGRKMKIQAIW